MHERADGIGPRVSVRDHHALRLGGRAARVVDGQEIVFVDFGSRETAFRRTQGCLVFHPTFPSPRSPPPPHFPASDPPLSPLPHPAPHVPPTHPAPPPSPIA